MRTWSGSHSKFVSVLAVTLLRIRIRIKYLRCFRLRVAHPGFHSLQERAFVFATASRTALVPIHPHIQLLPEILNQGVKRALFEADHSSPSSTRLRLPGAIANLSQYVFTQCCLMKQAIRLHGVVIS